MFARNTHWAVGAIQVLLVPGVVQATAPPYEPWDGSPLELPPIPSDPPEPVLGRPERPRRPVEVSGWAGFSLPSYGPADVPHHSEVGCLALFRPFPAVSVGPSMIAGGGNLGVVGSTSTLWWGAIVRTYARERGPWEPYLELGIGAEHLEMAGNRSRLIANGPNVRVGGGVEVFVLPRLRGGLALDLSHFWANHTRWCTTESCSSVSSSPQAGIGTWSFSARLTLLLGDAL